MLDSKNKLVAAILKANQGPHTEPIVNRMNLLNQRFKLVEDNSRLWEQVYIFICAFLQRQEVACINVSYRVTIYQGIKNCFYLPSVCIFSKTFIRLEIQ